MKEGNMQSGGKVLGRGIDTRGRHRITIREHVFI